jgi:hypothetical protein
METKIKNFFRKIKTLRSFGETKGYKFLAAGLLGSIIFSLFGILNFTKPAYATTCATGNTVLITSADNFTVKSTSSLYNNTGDKQYHFYTKVVDAVGDDETNIFSYSWQITGGNLQSPIPLPENKNDFEDPLTGGTSAPAGAYSGTPVPPGTYTANVTLTSLPGCVYDGTIEKTVTKTGYSDLTVGSGSTVGYKAKIASATSNMYSTSQLQYQIIAELDDANGNVVMGGTSNQAPTSNNWSWAWQICPVANTGCGTQLPVTNSDGTPATGYNIQFTFPSTGLFYINATATNTSDPGASPVKSPTMTIDTSQPNGALGSTSTEAVSISCTPTSGFKYQCVDSNYSPNSSTSTTHSGLSYDWNVDGKDLGTGAGFNGYSVPVTFVQGSNTVSVLLSGTGSPNLGKDTKTYTLDANGNVTSTNGSGSTGADSCSGGISSITCIVARVIGAVMEMATDILASLTTHLLVPIMVMVINIQPHTAAFSAVIVQEWVFIRNICNIFFIAAMIILGMSTILRLNGYDWHKTIPALVIAALTVNFSLAFSQAIIGVADVAQAQFLGVCQTGSVTTCQSEIVIQNLAYQLMTAPLSHLSTVSASTVPMLGVALFSDVLYLLVAIVSLFALVALTAFLIIRIIALWLLLMTSPVGYVLGMFPIKSLSKYSSMWWSNFWKFTFLTPLLALFLHICALLATTQAAFVAGTINSGGSALSGVATFQTVATDVLSAILVAACLGMAISTAGSMSGKAGQAVAGTFGNYKDKVLGAPQRWAGAGVKAGTDYAKEGFDRTRQNLGGKLALDANGNPRAGVAGSLGRMANLALNPMEGYNAWRSGTQAKNKTAKEVAEARAQRLQNLRRTGFDNKDDVKILQKKEDERMSKYVGMDPKKWRETFDTLRNKNTPESRQEMVSALNAAAKSGVLRRDIEGRLKHPASSAEMAQEIAGMVPAGANTSLFYGKLDEIGKEKNDLSLIGLGAADMFAEKATFISTMKPEDVASIRPDGIDNKAVADAIATRIANMPPEQGANKLSSAYLNSMGAFNGTDGVNYAAAAVGKMDPGSVLGIKLKDITNLGANNAVQEAIVSAAAGNKDIANKASASMLANMNVANRKDMILTMTSSNAIANIDTSHLEFSPEGPITEQESNDLKSAFAKQLQSHRDAIDKTSNDVLKMTVDHVPATDTNTINQINKKINPGSPVAPASAPTPPTPAAATPSTPPTTPTGFEGGDGI